jgi:hypothetical protein
LEVSADDEKIYTWPTFSLAGFLDGGIDGMEGAMSATFDSETYT